MQGAKTNKSIRFRTPLPRTKTPPNQPTLKLLENVQRPGKRLHAGVAIGTLQNEGMIRADLLAVNTLGPHAPLRRTLPLVGPRIDGRGRGLTKLPTEPGALKDLRNNTLPGGRRCNRRKKRSCLYALCLAHDTVNAP